MEDLKHSLPTWRADNFLLSVCPAENIFPHPAIPILVDHKRGDYLILPQSHQAGKISIHQVEKVQSVTRDGKVRPFVPFERLPEKAPGDGCYAIHVKANPISGKPEHYLRIIYDRHDSLVPETLSVTLKCSNIDIADQLRTGEITVATDSSPAMATFANIIPPTHHGLPLMEDEQQWRMFSHLHVNLIPRLTAKSLREVLLLHAIPRDPDVGRSLSNAKRINAIENLEIQSEDHFIKGRPIRGTLVKITVDGGGFGSMGDLHIFGEVLDHFLGLFHHLNTYTRLVIHEKNSREVLSWSPRLGTRRLT
jgi:type VI secretion system protein ImpG